MSRSDDRRKKHDVAAALKKIDIRTSVGRATGRWRWSRARLPLLQPSKKSILRNVLSLLPLCSQACGPFNGESKKGGLLQNCAENILHRLAYTRKWSALVDEKFKNSEVLMNELTWWDISISYPFTIVMKNKQE